MGIKRLRRIIIMFTVIAALLFICCARAFAASGPGAREDVYLTVNSRTAVQLSWPEYSSSGYNYLVQVKTDDGVFDTVAELPRATTSYDYTGIRMQSVYVFRVMTRRASAGGDGEAYYNEVVYRPAASPVEISFPELTQVSPSETSITWSYAEGAAYATEIQRRRDGDDGFSFVALVQAGVNKYTDSGVAPDTLYRYRVRARYDVAVFSAFREASVSTAIESPEIIEIYAASPSSVYVAWSSVSAAHRYQLERRLRGTNIYEPVTATTYSRTYYTDSGAVPGERYFYRVRAVSSNNSESLFSEEVEIVVLLIETSQTLVAVSTGDHRVELTWQDVGDKESTYEIWRSDEQFPGWELLDTVPRDTAMYIDERVGPGERYYYKVRARSAEYDAVSRFSAEVYTETKFIRAPSNLRQTNPGANPVDLAWRDNSDDETRFVIERRAGGSGHWAQVTSTAANITERAGLQAPANSAWYFRVGAYSSEYRSIAYCEPLLADNGFNMYFRGSSYRTDANVPDGGGPASARGQGSAPGSARSEARLDANAIRDLERRNIVRSSGNGAIAGGGEYVTRGEFTAMLVRALRVDERPVGSFGDVKQNHAYYKEIMQAARLGFARAETADLFFPDRIITREEMAEFVFDSLLTNGTPLPAHGQNALRPFPDANETPGEILDKVRAVFGEGIMIGIGVGGGRILGLEQNATREQAALVVYRYMQWLAAG